MGSFAVLALNRQALKRDECRRLGKIYWSYSELKYDDERRCSMVRYGLVR